MMKSTDNIDAKEIAIRCIRDESDALLGLIDQIDDNFDKAVNLMMSCKGHVVVTGVGKSGHVAAKIAATLASTGTPSFYLNPLDALHGDLGMVTDDDVVMLLSHSGNTDEMLRLIDCIQERRIKIISVTGDCTSLMAKHSDVHVLVRVDKEACPLNLAPTSSTTATMAMGDAFACALMEKRRFKKNDFARFHPGGSIGYKLVTKVKDVMYKGNFPILPPEMKLSDALIHISNGKLGLGVIIEDDVVKGIITDGDIRRAVEGAQSNFFNLTVQDCMTKNPKTIDPEAKLAKIQSMFKYHKIHSLLVVDKDKHLIGIVDYFAIMR